MMDINIREIAKMSIQEVIDRFNECDESFNVEFDDGTLRHNGAEIVFTRFILNYWNKLPRDFQIVKRYSIAYERGMDPHTPLRLCSRIYQDYVDEYEMTEWDIDDERMNRVVYRDVINALYNFHVEHLTAYAQGASSLDIIELLNHPPIREANHKIQNQKRDPTPEEISAVHQVISREILTSPDLKHNSFAIALRSKTIKMMQMTMVIGPIGYCTDINSSLFPRPLRWGFYEGNAKLWEMAIESRNASIASLYNELIMPESQYANRRYQLFAHPIRWVVRQDCGSRRYKRTLITDATKLSRMSGIWRLDEASGKLICIKGNEKELVGKMILHRSVTKCGWSASRSEICAVCYGRLYRAVMKHPKDSPANIKGRNPGHLAGIQLGGAGSSVVLSRKHANSTSVAAQFELPMDAQGYMRVSEDGRFLLFHEYHRTKDTIKLKLMRDQVEKLYDIKAGVTPMIAAGTLTHIDHFTIIDMNLEEGRNSNVVMLGSKQRTGHLSIEAVEYICNKGWEFDSNRDLVIDLSDWDTNLPVFIIPQIELSPPEFIEGVTSFLLGPTDAKKQDVVVRRLDSYKNIDDAIDAFHHEIADHLNVHYSHLSVLVLALSAQDPDNDDFRLPFPRDSGVVVTETPLLYNSSAGMQMAYELQHKILSDPRSFVLHKRRGHSLDSLLLSRVYGNRRNKKV